MREMRRSLAAIVLMVLFGGIGAPVTCAGWEVSASERMACCQRAQHGPCDEQRAADNCCAGQEQSRQAGSTVTAAPQAGPAPTVALSTPAFDSTAIAQVAAMHLERTITRRLHGPPGLLAPPLRI
jgi:hypothetical protein